jgi:hypothetical protein
VTNAVPCRGAWTYSSCPRPCRWRDRCQQSGSCGSALKRRCSFFSLASSLCCPEPVLVK